MPPHTIVASGLYSRGLWSWYSRYENTKILILLAWTLYICRTMDIETFRDYCIAKKGVTEGFPFGEGVLVFKVMGKMFALTAIGDSEMSVNLKMDEQLVEEYRERYADIRPGYHMNKKMWNSIYFDTGSIPHRELLWLVDHSYEQVVNGMPKKLQRELTELP